MSKSIKVLYENKKEYSRRCIDNGWDNIDKENSKKIHSMSLLNKEMLSALENIIKQVMSEGNNKVFAPVTLYVSLIILARITAGSTRKQILDALGISENDMFEKYYALQWLVKSDSGVAMSDTSTSLWLNKNMDYNEGQIKKICKRYQLDSYAGEMGDNTIDEKMSDWVNKTTGGMLEKDINIKTTNDTLLEMLSTVYFRAGWSDEFDVTETRIEPFYLKDDETVEAYFMSQKLRMQYHCGRQFSAISKEFNSGYTGVFILPDESISIDTIIQDSQFYELAFNGRLRTSKEYEVDLSLPKFDMSSKLELMSILPNIGIKEVLDPYKADFTMISNEEEIALSKAEQTTRFKINEEGAEAASFVELGFCAAGIPPKCDEIVFKLNRPFIFMVLSMNSMPIFVGKVNNPN